MFPNYQLSKKRTRDMRHLGACNRDTCDDSYKTPQTSLQYTNIPICQ